VLGYRRIMMNEAEWDGSDVFAIPGLGCNVFVSERVGTALLKLKLRNVSIKRNTECTMP
jgi:hypothetical protein